MNDALLTLTDESLSNVAVQRVPAVATRHDDTTVSSVRHTGPPVTVLYVYTYGRRVYGVTVTLLRTISVITEDD